MCNQGLHTQSYFNGGLKKRPRVTISGRVAMEAFQIR